MNSIIAILAAVHHRKKTGEGQFLDISMLDGLIPLHAMQGVSYLVDNKIPQRERELLNGGSFYDFCPCADGRYFSVGALEPQFWSLFCRTIHKEEWIEGGGSKRYPLKKRRIKKDFSKKNTG